MRPFCGGLRGTRGYGDGVSDSVSDSVSGSVGDSVSGSGSGSGSVSGSGSGSGSGSDSVSDSVGGSVGGSDQTPTRGSCLRSPTSSVTGIGYRPLKHALQKPWPPTARFKPSSDK